MPKFNAYEAITLALATAMLLVSSATLFLSVQSAVQQEGSKPAYIQKSFERPAQQTDAPEGKEETPTHLAPELPSDSAFVPDSF